MGMNLSDKLIEMGMLKRENIYIMAVDDSFVAIREKGQSVYDAAGLSKDHIIQASQKLFAEKAESLH